MSKLIRSPFNYALLFSLIISFVAVTSAFVPLRSGTSCAACSVGHPHFCLSRARTTNPITILLKSTTNDEDEDDDGWGSAATSDKERELAALQQEMSTKRQQTASAASSSSQEEQERDLFIPIFALVSLAGLFGSYGYEMARLYPRGELYLPWEQ